MQTRTRLWMHANITQTQLDTHTYRYIHKPVSLFLQLCGLLFNPLSHNTLKSNKTRALFWSFRPSIALTVNYFIYPLHSNLRGSVCSLWIDITPVRHFCKAFLKTTCVERLSFLSTCASSVPDTHSPSLKPHLKAH